MNDIAIRLEGLGKQYLIGSKRARYNTLRDALTDAVAAPFRRLSSVARSGGDSSGPSRHLPKGASLGPARRGGEDQRPQQQG